MAERNRNSSECRDMRSKSEAFPCTILVSHAHNPMITVRTAPARLLSTPCTPILPKIATSAPKKAERTAYHAQFIVALFIPARRRVPASRVGGLFEGIGPEERLVEIRRVFDRRGDGQIDVALLTPE